MTAKETKQCRRCGRLKPITNFCPKPKGDGRVTVCYTCKFLRGLNRVEKGNRV